MESRFGAVDLGMKFIRVVRLIRGLLELIRTVRAYTGAVTLILGC